MYYEQDFINDIASGIVHENDIDDYVRTNDVNSLYDYIMLEEIVEHSDHLVYALRYLETKYGCSWTNETGQGTAKVMSPFRALVNHPDVDKFMEGFHKRHDGFNKSCDRGRLITKCVNDKYLSRFPTQEEYESEFEYIKKGGRTYSWKSIEKYLDVYKDGWQDIKLAF